jgi:hypothetical protein
VISADDLARFETLRADLFDTIRQCLERDGHCKHYEGRFAIQLPDYFGNEQWGLFLDCYVVGPSRHYEWWGASFAEALVKAETDIRAWMHEAQEDEQ